MNQRIEKLIAEMTPEEKACQLTQVNAVILNAASKGEITGVDEGMQLTEKDVAAVGSVLNYRGAKEALAIQKNYLSESKKKIPLIMMLDVVHGCRTIFPVPLAMGCTFDPDLLEECAKMSATEAKYQGLHVTFSPMVDLARDARWGRVMETTGEDPYLNGEMGKAFIRGYHAGGIACCVKHFAAYGAPEGGREYNTTDISERNLREYYLRSYGECIKEKPEMVMSSFNLLNGIPVNGHKDLLVGILREEWGFDGVLVSDYGAVREMITHGYLETMKECAETSIENQLDLEMMSSAYIHHLPELMREGAVSEKRVDESLRRVLELKEKAGLFENPYGQADEEKAEQVSLSPEFRALARRAAIKSAVLLKNNGALPLSEKANVFLAGPFADEKNILGTWVCYGDPAEAVSVREGVENLLKRRVPCVRGCGAKLLERDESGIPAAVGAAKEADVVVACVGEPSDCCGESTSRADLRIPPVQAKLLEELKKTGKKVVAVIFGGRPQALEEILPFTDAILYVWQPGTEGGNAVAELLFGKENPSGKLTMSFPRKTGQCPIYYNCFNTGRPRIPDTIENSIYISSYRDTLNAPLYPFGYGLSYTEFALSDLTLSSADMCDGAIEAEIDVANIGSREGETVVQLYIRDKFASVVRPLKELKAFRKVFLRAGEKRRLRFTVTEEMLRFYTASGKFASEAGRFDVMIGLDSEKVLSKEFLLIK